MIGRMAWTWLFVQWILKLLILFSKFFRNVFKILLFVELHMLRILCNNWSLFLMLRNNKLCPWFWLVAQNVSFIQRPFYWTETDKKTVLKSTYLYDKKKSQNIISKIFTIRKRRFFKFSFFLWINDNDITLSNQFIIVKVE